MARAGQRVSGRCPRGGSTHHPVVVEGRFFPKRGRAPARSVPFRKPDLVRLAGIGLRRAKKIDVQGADLRVAVTAMKVEDRCFERGSLFK
jgi:hypothetical protein